MGHGTNEARSAMGGGGGNHMERHGAGRAEGAEREGWRGRKGRKGRRGGEGGEGGHALDPLKSAERVSR